MLCKDLSLDLFFSFTFLFSQCWDKTILSNCFKLSSECETVFGNYAMWFFIFLL